jgi:hypothetical protein
MSHLQLVHSNTNFLPGSVFNPTKQALLNRIQHIPGDRELATAFVQRNAPDLMGMIFGGAA